MCEKPRGELAGWVYVYTSSSKVTAACCLLAWSYIAETILNKLPDSLLGDINTIVRCYVSRVIEKVITSKLRKTMEEQDDLDLQLQRASRWTLPRLQLRLARLSSTESDRPLLSAAKSIGPMVCIFTQE